MFQSISLFNKDKAQRLYTGRFLTKTIVRTLKNNVVRGLKGGMRGHMYYVTIGIPKISNRYAKVCEK